MGLGHSPRIVTDGLVLCLDAANARSYPGTGTTWTDLKGGKTATLINAPTYSSDNAGTFSLSTNEYFQTNLNFSGSNYSNFSCSVWCKHGDRSGTTVNEILVSNYAGTPIPFNLYAAGSNWDGEFVFYTRNNGYVELHSTTSIDDDNWHFCVATKSSDGTHRVYVDGELENSTSSSVSTPHVTNSIVIGVLNYYLNSHYNGSIGGVSIYDRALTAKEVRQNYEATKGRYE